jgi:uncharacterized protein
LKLNLFRVGRRVGWWASLVLAGCASAPDHFYTLSPLPDTERGVLSTPIIHVLLGVTVPSLVDRAEMVIDTSKNGALILDHERWAVPLSDQVAQTLARDLERRRRDVLVGDRGFDQPHSPPVTIKVDIVRMSAQRGGRASIEARWRIVDASANVDEVGGDLFDAALDGDGYASVARAYSQTLSALAEKLAAALPRR